MDHEELATTGLMGSATRVYERSLKFVIAYPLILAVGSIGLIVASYFCYQSLGTDLLPAMDEGGFILDYLMPAGSSLADIRTTSDSGHPIVVAKPDSPHAQAYKNIAGRVWKQLTANQRGPRAAPRIVVR